MGNRVITFIKDDDSNVINVQQFLLRDEFERAMSICGCISVTDIDTSVIVSLKGNK